MGGQRSENTALATYFFHALFNKCCFRKDCFSSNGVDSVKKELKTFILMQRVKAIT